MSNLSGSNANGQSVAQDITSDSQQSGSDPPKKRKPRRPRKPRKDRRNNGSEQDPPEHKIRTDYATLLMDVTQPTPPVEAELRLLDVFQSLMTGTLYQLSILLWHIASSPVMMFEPSQYVMSQISLDGDLFCFFICLAVSVKMSFVVDSLISHRLGYRTNKMTGAVHRELGGFYTIDRGIAVMEFLGLFVTSQYETTFPTYLMDAHGFLLLAWVYCVSHLMKVFILPNGWCRNSSWKRIFHNAETSKCGVADMDAPGATLDTWFSCFDYDPVQQQDLVLRLSRMFVDEEDFRITFAGLTACLIVNTFNCEIYVKGQRINSGADTIMVDPGSRSPIDLYHYAPGRRALARSFMIIDRLGNIVLTNVQCRNTSPVDPYFEMAQAAGNGRYTVNLTMGHVFAALRDSNMEVLTRAGTIYYDPAPAGPRIGAGFNAGRCEAVMLIMAYGGMTLLDENYLGHLGTFANYFHGDGNYFQDDNAGVSMEENGLYVAFFEKHLTLLIPTIKSFCRFLGSIYLAAFRRFGLKLIKMPALTITGSTTQLFTSIPCYKGGRDKPFMDHFNQSTDFRPSMLGSSMNLTAVRKNDMGLLVAPNILVESVAESSVLSGGTYQAAGLSFIENPACPLRDFPEYNPGFN